jgi:hypothetical protein
MRSRAVSIDVAGFMVAQLACAAEWLPGAGSAGPRTTWQAIPANAFAEVPVSKFALAQAILRGDTFVPREPLEAKSLLGPGASFACEPGSRAYIVRALYSGTGQFSLYWSKNTLVVAHESLGAAGSSGRSALIACLARAPVAVVSFIGGAL